MNPQVTISIDGDKCCFLIGEDLQVGIAGFGDDPMLALMDLWQNIEQWSKDEALLEWAKTFRSQYIEKFTQ